MTERETDPDDRAIDALIDSLARPDAPRDLAARIVASLDARQEPAIDPASTRRLIIGGLAFAVLILAIWIGAGPQSPAPARSAQRAPTPPAAATPEVSPQQPARAATTETPSPAIASRVGRSETLAAKPHAASADHERALAALDPVASLKPGEIAPATIGPHPIDIEPISEIAPLVTPSGRDTSGRGDFK